MRAWLTALIWAAIFGAAAIVVAGVAVPWDAAVAPWPIGHSTSPDLHALAREAFTAAQRMSISSYVDSVWLPALLAVTVGPVVGIILGFTPLGGRLVGACRDRVLVTAACVLILIRLLALPFEWWSALVRRDHGLLVEPWLQWWGRWLLTTAAIVVIGALVIWVVMAVLRRWPVRGWIAVVLLAIVGSAALSLAAPLLDSVEGTSSDPRLRHEVMDIAARAGVEVGDVRVVDVADSSPALNAHVSGWGPTRTVTIYDTVLASADDAEIQAIVAHELMHVREGDVVLGTVLAALGAGAVSAAAMALVLSASERGRFGARSPGDARLVPLLVAVVCAGLLISLPVSAAVSRPIELRADREAIAVTGDPAAYARMITLLTTSNLSSLEPPDWRYSLLFTHPTPLQRLADAR